jgi:hypothetical protein
MHTHGPCTLKGPVTQEREWWQGPPRRRTAKPIRGDLVGRVRREIAAGTYDTPERFALALDRMLNQLYER